MDDNQCLKPGVNIKPIVTIAEVKSFAKEHYGLTPSLVVQMNGYDDLNYKLDVDSAVTNNHIQLVCENGYVFKIMNSLDSQDVPFVEAQNSMMIFLRQNDINSPKLIKTKHGNYYTFINCTSGRHIARLLEFIPGTILHQVPRSALNNKLFYNTGQYVAHMDKILQKFHHPAYNVHKSIWSLDAVPQLRQFLFAIKNETRLATVNEIINDFENRVLSIRGQLKPGMIHGDFNEQNIICTESASGEWDVTGVLDFGDSQYSCYLYELAIAVTYMILLAKSLNEGGFVIAGYSSVWKIPDNEIRLLKICICARLCQSLVMGAYTSYQDPSNTYVLTTAEVGWSMLFKIWNTPETSLLNSWNKIIENYKTL